MIDSLRIWTNDAVNLPHELFQTSEHLEAGHHFTKKTYNAPPLFLTWRSEFGRCQLHLQTNPPKILYGHNVRVLTLTELRSAISEVDRRIAALFPQATVPPIDAWRIGSVDYVHAWHRPDPSSYVRAMYDELIPAKGQTRKLIDDGRGGWTLSVGPKKEWQLRLYDKGAEIRSHRGLDRPSAAVLAEAKNQLRLEVRVEATRLKRWFGEPVCLGQVVDELGWDRQIHLAFLWRQLQPQQGSAEYDDAWGCLLNKFEKRKATRLLDHWVHLQKVGVHTYRTKFAVDDSTWSRLQTDLRLAGVGSARFGGCEPLELQLPSDDEPWVDAEFRRLLVEFN